MKKTITFIALILTVLALTLTMVACGETGAQGEQGIQGEDGHSPEIKIGTNGNWFIDGVDTGVSAKGSQGETGAQGEQGIQGEDGHSPEIKIGTNGNWFIDGVDTGVSAKGSQGEIGATGPQGPQGDDGDVGQPGKDGTSLFTDNGAPSATLGKMGDSYIDLDSFDFYVRNETEWVLSGNIKGSDATIVPDYIGSDGLAFYPLNDTECAVSVGTARFLEKIVIPETYKGYKVVRILEEGFSECENLKTISIPDSVTTIGFKAFYHCNNLTTIKLPFVGETKDGTKNTHLGYIFGAESYTESNQVDFIPQNLKEVFVTGGTIGDYAFYYYLNLTTIVLPEDIESIGDYAFYHCSSLGHVTIPSGVKTIGEHAFDGCFDLIGVIMNKSVTDIGDYAFYGCNELERVTIPNSVITIGNSAFKECHKLKEVTIGNGVTTIDAHAFEYCDNLTNVYYTGSEEQWANIYIHEDNESLFNAAIHCMFVYELSEDGTFYIISGIDGCTCTDLVIPSTYNGKPVVSIQIGAFNEWLTLTSVVIPDSVKAIGPNAFYNCKNLTSVTFGEDSQLILIDVAAFGQCTNLTNIVLPKSVKKINRAAFNRCKNLTDVHFTGTEEQWGNITMGANNDALTSATVHFNYIPEDKE